MRHVTLLCAVSILFFSGCLDSNEGFLPFDFIVDYTVPQTTVPGDPILALLPPQQLPDIPVPIDLQDDSDFSSQIFDHLSKIKLRELVFTIAPSSTDPAADLNEPDPVTPDDWSFLVSVEIWIEHPVTSVQAPIAYINEGNPQLDPGETTLSFFCFDTDLLEYFDSNYCSTIIIKAYGKVPPDNVIFNAAANFKVTAVLIK